MTSEPKSKVSRDSKSTPRKGDPISLMLGREPAIGAILSKDGHERTVRGLETLRRSGVRASRLARRALLSSGCLFVSLYAGHAMAQDAPTSSVSNPPISAPPSEPGAPSMVQEIIVTSLRRSENIQSVPVSVSAVGGAALQQQKIDTPAALAQSVPNLQSSEGSAPGAVVYAIRGVSLNDPSVNQSGPIATYYDEVYKGPAALQPIGIFDIDHIEVLRGPQGTLYGKNTTGGAINFISQTPTFKTGGYLTVGLGNYNRREANGAFETTLSDNLAVRVAGAYLTTSGYVHNVAPGAPDVASTRQYAVRATAVYRPTDSLSFTLRATFGSQNPINYGFFSVPDASAGVTGGVFGIYERGTLKKFEIDSPFAPRFHHQSNALALTSTYEINDSLLVTSVTAGDYGYFSAPSNLDGSPNNTFIGDVYASNAHQFAQDLRLTTSFAGPTNFIVGLYYNNESMKNKSQQHFYGFGYGLRNSFKQEKTSKALYVDGTYKLSDRITLRGGLRGTLDSGDYSRYNANYYLLDDVTPLLGPGSGIVNGRSAYDTHNLSGKAGVDFKVNSTALLYASISRGFRGSAFNANAYDSVDQIAASKPETLTAYETGFKTQWLDRALTINGAAYYYEYQNQQAYNQVGALSVLYGIPKSRIYGGELEVVGRILPGLAVNASVGYADGEIVEATIFGTDLKGNQLPLASKVTTQLAVNWTAMDNESGSVKLGVDAAYFSKKYFDLFESKKLAQGAYALLNAHVEYRTSDDKYGISIWARNITNKFYFTNNFDFSFLGADVGNIGTPRTFGASLDAKF